MGVFLPCARWVQHGPLRCIRQMSRIPHSTRGHPTSRVSPSFQTTERKINKEGYLNVFPLFYALKWAQYLKAYVDQLDTPINHNGVSELRTESPDSEATRHQFPWTTIQRILAIIADSACQEIPSPRVLSASSLVHHMLCIGCRELQLLFRNRAKSFYSQAEHLAESPNW